MVRATLLFDDDNLVSDGGWVPVLTLAEQAGLSELVAEKVTRPCSRHG